VYTRVQLQPEYEVNSGHHHSRREHCDVEVHCINIRIPRYVPLSIYVEHSFPIQRFHSFVSIMHLLIPLLGAVHKVRHARGGEGPEKV